MANVPHKNWTDPEIHEPKGIATALVDTVYVSDGAGSGTWQEIETVNPADVVLPVGLVGDFAGVNAPQGWLFCYGQTVSRITYADLFAVIGTVFGVGDGSTTFGLPDCRGRAVAGQDDMGTVSANRLTSPLNGDSFGATGGVEEHTLTTSEVPVFTGTTSSDGAHTHTATPATSLYRVSSSGNIRRTTNTSSSAHPTQNNLTTLADGAHTHTVSVNSTGGDPHSNMQPSIIFNKIIYTGVL